MKNLIWAVALLLAGASFAAAEPVFDVGYSTFATLGVAVTSGTSVTGNPTRPTSFTANVGYYRLTNSHPSWDIYVGDINVSTDVFNANVGHVIKAAGGSVVWPVAKDLARAGKLVPFYLRAADSSAVDRLPRLSITWFGY